MINNLRVVVDTNVLVSGLLGIKNSPSSQILNAVRSQKIILVSSPVILEEVEKVIGRERIAKLTKMSKKEQKEFINELIERIDITAGKQLTQIISRDVKDDKFLAAAFEAKADYLITGDKDLLVLKKFRGTKIIKPRKFITILSAILSS
ncbi:putative toxin-antitoxin system toxin component, PIN family [Candidatus Gottesmanbacteria bacterium RBG_16_37_8]|uniref:Putative toxin-antitoxin system toxin component, PIN family n=1 Tax=Candidatus Gottesmanbacteria bacterium RBG_16_37_8 TaxID=1798371 RepID=A0A1F5YS65_9BACT|nr:MAG: putative toxin-antitoxin system toxin component, PIN family [Candidatus Gottesmanbacteria bacterium RBG_16_37_8]